MIYWIHASMGAAFVASIWSSILLLITVLFWVFPALSAWLTVQLWMAFWRDSHDSAVLLKTSHMRRLEGLSSRYATPITARTAATMAIVWPSVVTLLDAIIRGVRLWSLALAVASAIFHGFVGYHALRARSRLMATVGMAVGAMCLFLGFSGLHVLASPEQKQWPIRLVVLTVWTTAYAALLPQLVWKDLVTEAHEGSDMVQIISAVWVATPVGIALWIGVHGTSRRFPSGLAIAAGLLLPLGVVFAAALRMKARRRWLERIATGEDLAWRIVDGEQTAEELPVLTRPTPGTAMSVLVRVQRADEPFRASEHLEPVARVAHRPGTPRQGAS